jgi:hypothetical protein
LEREGMETKSDTFDKTDISGYHEIIIKVIREGQNGLEVR